MTTINTSDEKILKNDILENLFTEESAVKVYKNIYGLNNVGRTFFTSEQEVMDKDNDAQTQMMQKYGAEVYGGNAQLTKQRNSGTFSASGYTEASDGKKASVSAGGLIECSVSALPQLPDKFFEASGGSFQAFGDSLAKFVQHIKKKLEDDEWKSAHGADAQKVLDNRELFRAASGAADKTNSTAWNAINEMLDSETWKKEIANDKKLKGIVDEMRNGWNQWAGKEDGGALAGGKPEEKQGSSVWNPRLPFRITIKTNFDENWFKRKYKSGMLNGIINAVKTSAMARSAGTAAASNPEGHPEWQSGHKFTADEMLPADVKKLDSIRWKMTNKVAKDYVTYLLGWKRKKTAQRKADKDKTIVATSELERDSGIGGKFAKSALSGRGIFGRLMQKMFAGGKSSNEISIAFQVADWRDGWEVVDEKTGERIDMGGDPGGNGNGEGGGDGGKSGGSSGGGSGSGLGGSSMGFSSGKNGTGGSGAADVGGKGIEKLLSLLQRVIRLEDEVGVGPGSKGQNANGNGKNNQNKDKKPEKDKWNKNNQNKDITKEPMNESDDPFYGVFDDLDFNRRALVEEACNCGEISIANLVDDCLNAHI